MHPPASRGLYILVAARGPRCENKRMESDLVQGIPHRPPMRWLDDAALQADGTVAAHSTISAEHPFLNGGRLPRSALIEMMAQTAACAGVATAAGRGGRGMLIGLRDVAIAGAPAIGERVELQVKMIQRIGNMFLCEGSASVGGREIVHGQFSLIWLPA